MLPRQYLIILLLLSYLVCPGWLLSSLGQSVGEDSDERIHLGDLIEIDELGGFDFDWRGRMNPEGYLDGFTKVADPVFALCKSPAELAQAVRTAYSRTLRDPKVTVRILDKGQRAMAVFDGAIRQPMRLQLRRTIRLSELAAISGGFTDKASGEISVLRPPNQSCDASSDTAQLISVRISDILSGKPEANLKILSGDIVTVKTVEPVYVIGGVNRPGKVDWRPGATVSRAVAAAGGVSDKGISGRVTVFRRDTTRTDRIVAVDLDRVLSGKLQDPQLNPFDIVDVPLRGDPKRNEPPVIGPEDVPGRRESLPLRVVN